MIVDLDLHGLVECQEAVNFFLWDCNLLQSHKSFKEDYMQYSKKTEIFGKNIDIKFNDCISDGEKQTFHDRALTLYIHINKICNARCSFCNIYKHSTPKVNFDFQKLSTVLQELLAKNKLGRIAITGGETFFDIELLDKVLATISENVINPIVTINTNASMLYKIYKLKNINVLSEVRISRHHYLDEENDAIFGIKCATLSEILTAVNQFGNLIKLNCNLIKGHIDSVEEISMYLDTVSSIGISEVGFVGLMPFNEYCIENYVDYSNFTFSSNFLRVRNLKDSNICQCDNFLYLSPQTCKTIQVYFRQVRKLECTYCRQFSYSYDNKLIGGFGEKVIY